MQYYSARVGAAMTLDLFPDEPEVERRDDPLAAGALLLRAFARDRGPALLEALGAVQQEIRAAEAAFGDSGRVVVRFSGTEPLSKSGRRPIAMS